MRSWLRPITQRRVTRYGFRTPTWIPFLAVGLAAMLYAAGRAVTGVWTWAMMAATVVGLVSLLLAWLVITDDAPPVR